MNESWGDTDDEPLINVAQAVRHCTDADRPAVLVTADGPTYINVPEDTGELSSDDEPLINIAKRHSRLAVVTVLRLSLSVTCLVVAAVLRLPLLVT